MKEHRRQLRWLMPLFVATLGCTEILLHDLPEHEANALVSELALIGLSGQKKPAGGKLFDVEVARVDSPKARAVAHAAGFPRAMAVEPTQRLLLGPREAAALERRRKAEALATLLRRREDIVDARVVLDADGAAVLLRTRPGKTFHDDQILATVRTGGGLAPDAPIQLDTVVVDHSRSAMAPSPTPKWPLQLASAAVAGLSLLCLVLLGRLRRIRQQHAGETPPTRS